LSVYSETHNRDELFDEILTGKFEFASPFWDKISSSAKQLISGLLTMDDTKRLTADEMLQHPWVSVSVRSQLHAVTLTKVAYNIDTFFCLYLVCELITTLVIRYDTV